VSGATDDRVTAAMGDAPVAPSPRIYAGVFLLSATVLMLEVALTRILSVLLRFHSVPPADDGPRGERRRHRLSPPSEPARARVHPSVQAIPNAPRIPYALDSTSLPAI